MCRFLCCSGPPVPLSDVLYRPGHSLIRQSYTATARAEPLNGDGFGVGWYAPEVAATPCVFTSVSPAWSNQNLRRLAEHASARGSTDSEHAFAVFLDRLGDTDTPRTPRDLARALVETVARLEEWTAEAGADAPSYYNLAVTDGSSIVAVRYVSDPSVEPISLYFRVVGEPPDRPGATAASDRAVMLASERLSGNKGDWRRVAPNHAVIVSADREVKVELVPVPLAARSARPPKSTGSPA